MASDSLALSILPEDPDAAVRAMCGIIRKLDDLISRETSALLSRDTLSVLALQPEKEKAADLYARGASECRIRIDALRNAQSSLRHDLEDIQSQFDVSIRENVALLEQIRRKQP